MRKKILLIISIAYFFGCKDEAKPKKSEELNNPVMLRPIERDYENMLGFACFSGGSMSESVAKMTEFLRHKDFVSIKSSLTSKNNSEKFLAVILCEKFREKGQMYLSNEEATIINGIKNSPEFLEICSGCTYYEKFSLKQIFDNKKHFIWKRIDLWISENYIH